MYFIFLRIHFQITHLGLFILVCYCVIHVMYVHMFSVTEQKFLEYFALYLYTICGMSEKH